MSGMPDDTVLVVNAGSSSLKVGLFVPLPGINPSAGLGAESAIAVAEARGVGSGEGKLEVKDGQGKTIASVGHAIGSQTEALEAVVKSLKEQGFYGVPKAIGHRVVHGGPHLLQHTQLTPQVLATLQQSIHFAPLHLPGSLALIEVAEKLFPGTEQVACFDTAFHQSMPPEATTLPIPREFQDQGIRRYGFHGLSYESVVSELRHGPAALPDRIVIAHLGGGSSLCAVKRGKSVDTTMGLTPTGGIVMATRTGDLDPGVLLMMERQGKLGTDALEQLVNHKSGLAGVSGGSGDMQELEKACTDRGTSSQARSHAALALDMFAIGVAKAISGLIVPLRGLDLLVFTGGIGEHSSTVRRAVVELLAPIGLRLDARKNDAHASEISATQSKVGIRIIPAEEDLIIAAHTRKILTKR
jgi:acetate kinase